MSRLAVAAREIIRRREEQLISGEAVVDLGSDQYHMLAKAMATGGHVRVDGYGNQLFEVVRQHEAELTVTGPMRVTFELLGRLG
jgi:hypothetical protein